MKLIYGTENPAKIDHMKEILQGIDVEIIGLNEVKVHVENIDESGNYPLENAKIKALAYFKATGKPVFSCDSGLYIEGINEARQPGVHVRRVGGKVLDDHEMIEYYSNLALEFGGEVKAKYKNAIALVIDENTIFTHDGDDISSVSFLISSKPHEKRRHGFPLDSLSLEATSKKYYMDLGTYKTNSTKGFRDFFSRVINEINES